jgi:uncharacterized protein with beta-barrel porin domain
MLWLLALCSLCPAFVYAESSETTAYVTSFNLSNLYRVDTKTGQSSIVTTIPGTGLQGVALVNSTTAYVSGYLSNSIYLVDLTTGQYSLVSTIPGNPNLEQLALASSTTAYTVSNAGNVYRTDLVSGISSLAAALPGSPELAGIALVPNSTSAYVAGNNTNQIYLVDLATGESSVVATISGNPGLGGIALVNRTTAYIPGINNNEIYLVDLTTGQYSIVATIPGNPGPDAVALANGTTLYTIGHNNPAVYLVDPTTGGSVLLATIPGNVLEYITFLLQIPTSGLTGNNLKFANYLNNNAPFDVLFSLSLQDNLAAALESAIPTRNAFVTFASQNGYLASSQVMSDHLRNTQFRREQLDSQKVISMKSERHFLADASDSIDQQSSPENPAPCSYRELYTIWASPFGEYAREKKQQQTPAFSLGLGGVVAGFDYNVEKNIILGIASAYVHTHIHENTGAGWANVDQGFLTLYGTNLQVAMWYFDLAIWGGYYHSDNYRKISFPGWQLAPHIEAGYDGFYWQDCGIHWFGIEPFVMGDWVGNWEHGFSEQGADGFNMGQKGRFCSLLRTEMGLRFHEVVEFDCGRLLLREKGSYAYQKAFHTGTINAFLIGAPGSFTVDTLTSAQNLGVGEFEILFVPKRTEYPYVSINYQGEFGSRYQSHQGMLEVGKDF